MKHPLIKKMATLALSTSLMIGQTQAALANLDKKNLKTSAQDLMNASTAVIKKSGVDQGFKSLVVLTDNDAALNNKLDIIRKANNNGRKGDKIDLVYFIYDKDESTSLLSYELLQAARRGVDIRILLDLHTNYKNFDFFKMLQVKSSNKIQVSFYNRPSNSIILSATYLTSKCSEENFHADLESATDGFTRCADEKLAQLDQAYSSQIKKLKAGQPIQPATEGAKQFLAGLYSKDPEILGQALLNGQGIDLENIQNGNVENASETEALKRKAEFAKKAESLKQFTNLVYKARFSKDFFEKMTNKLGLYFVLLTNKDARNLYNKLTGVLPLYTGKSQAYKAVEDERTNNFKHLTDYTHHKLLMLTGQTDQDFQLGGRNWQNSYHISDAEQALTNKYLFMDTDVRIQLNSKNQDLVSNFDHLWKHPVLTIALNDVEKQFPSTMATQLKDLRDQCLSAAKSNVAKKIASGLNADEMALVTDTRQRLEKFNQDCGAYSSVKKNVDKEQFKLLVKDEFKQCIKSSHLAPSSSVKSSSQRVQEEYNSLITNKDAFLAQQKSQSLNNSVKLDLSQDKNAMITYLENVPYTKKNPTVRLFGAQPDSDLNFSKSGKYIHESLLKGMKNVCAKSTIEKPQTIVLHNAYFAPPSNLVEVFAHMVDGTWDCSGVSVEIITNSLDTTDLSAVNLFSRHTMKAFFDYAKVNYSEKSAIFSLYEYQKPSQGKVKSLHTKLAVLGDSDMIIGSANLDIRSYMMDTNNGIYISNAPNLVKTYMRDFVNNTVKSQIHLVNDYYDNKLSVISKDDENKILCDAKRYGVDQFIKLDTLFAAVFNVTQALSGTNSLAQQILSKKQVMDSNDADNGSFQPLQNIFKQFNPKTGEFETIEDDENQHKSQSFYDDLLKVI